MEPLVLDITEANELTFKVQIQGADGSPAKIRLVCEGSDMSYMFNARATREVDTFDFIIPAMQNKLKEGAYKGRIEVVLENKHFIPVEFDLDFKQPVKVVAEAVSRVVETPRLEPTVTITAASVKAPVVPSGPRTPSLPVAEQNTLKARYSKRK